MSNVEGRHGLHEAARRTWGDQAAASLMEALPPMDWSQVATKQDLVLLKQDLALLEARVERRLAEEMRHVSDGMRRLSDEMRHQTTRFVTAVTVVAGLSLGVAEALSRVG